MGGLSIGAKARQSRGGRHFKEHAEKNHGNTLEKTM